MVLLPCRHPCVFLFIRFYFVLLNQNPFGLLVFKILQVWEWILFLSSFLYSHVQALSFLTLYFPLKSEIASAHQVTVLNNNHPAPVLFLIDCLQKVFGIYIQVSKSFHRILPVCFSERCIQASQNTGLFFYFVSASYLLCKWVIWALQKGKVKHII